MALRDDREPVEAVIARSKATKQSILSLWPMDCFARNDGEAVS